MEPKSDISHANSSMYFFSLIQPFLLNFSDSITAKNKKNSSKVRISVSEITLCYNSTNIINRRIFYNCTTLSIWAVYTNICV